MKKTRLDIKPAPKSAKISDKHRFVFSVVAEDAREVFLAGDFNGWSTKSHPMKKAAEGKWEKTVFLKPGEYEYKLYVDGHWCLDLGNEATCDNFFGTRNNIIRVAGKKSSRKA